MEMKPTQRKTGTVLSGSVLNVDCTSWAEPGWDWRAAERERLLAAQHWEFHSMPKFLSRALTSRRYWESG